MRDRIPGSAAVLGPSVVRAVSAAANLARIAAILGVPVSAFDDAGQVLAPVSAVALFADPDGARLAAAFLSIRHPAARAGAADAVECIAAAVIGDAGEING